MTTTELLTYANPLDDRQRAIITQWVKDLRSGDYPQVKGRLEDLLGNHMPEDTPDDEMARIEAEGVKGFCCIGVVIQRPAALEGTEYMLNTAFEYTTLTHRDNATADQTWESSLPYEVAAALGLTVRVPSPWPGDYGTAQLQSALIDLNDDFNWTFNQIADLVEAFLLNGEAWEPAYARISGQ